MARHFLIICLLLILAGLSACKSVKSSSSSSSDRFVKDSTIIIERVLPIYLPAAQVKTPTINIDSLASLLKAGVPASVINRTTVVEDPETRLRVGLIIDQLGNLTALCEQQEKMIETLEREIYRFRQENESLKSASKKVSKTFLPWYYWVIGLVILAILALIKFSKFKIF
jgi:hypothetical protein